MDKRNQIVSKFNTGITWFLELLSKKDPNDAEVARVRERIKLAKVADYEILVKNTGPYLMKYRDYIDDPKKIAEFFGKDPEETKKLDDAGRDLFNKVREYYKNMKPAEQKVVHQKVADLLSDYLDYLVETIPVAEPKK